MLERVDAPLEHRSQDRWRGPAIDDAKQLPVPLNPWIVGGLQSTQQLAAVVGGVGLAEGLGVPGDQIGQGKAALLGGWVDPAARAASIRTRS
jgi:hypothetical protein